MTVSEAAQQPDPGTVSVTRGPIAHGWLDEVLHPRAGPRYCFDAFVSYCGNDEPWVFEELLPNLEKRGPPYINLCLHNRDFQLGKDIVDNITDSLYSSRRTLCLVSTNYLRSNWCALELRLANHRLLVERKDVLILVFLEKISPFQLSVHHRLARLVKTRTYLEWPQDPNQRAGTSEARDSYVPNPSCREFHKIEWIGQLMGAELWGKDFLESCGNNSQERLSAGAEDFPAVDSVLDMTVIYSEGK
ncbi:hypothetical protein JZ751_014085 [Albula glossodonta]|uniref:TIR domain-containing protein n=1 Tax=Albula glossodonta TaxID=121402 RepID=A0A8T2NQG8_9TELE|nr:hypothetical protein JZ751_014085 [Albula glossodonta]